jgi:hypothetical protein
MPKCIFSARFATDEIENQRQIKIKPTHRNREDLTVVLVASFHHFIGILEEFGNHTDQGDSNNGRRSDERRSILASSTRSQKEKPKEEKAGGNVVIPHRWKVVL